MRQKRQIQLKLSGPWPDHPFSRELAVMAAILDANPVIAELAWQDIVEGRSHQSGTRPGGHIGGQGCSAAEGAGSLL